MRHAKFQKFVKASWLPALCLLAVAGCRSFTEGDIVIRNGEAYIFTKALTREQIAEGKEIEKLWLSYYYKTNTQRIK